MKFTPAPQFVTVVTVVFNADACIEQTILSVIGQNYTNFEYLIIDGGSTDLTIEIIKKYEDSITHWISESDNGIYDAMNKGIDLAQGDWVIFMNAGDTFFCESTLSDIFNNVDLGDVHVLYGDHQVKYSSGRKKYFVAGTPDLLWRGSQFCHQSCLINLNYHKQYKYNLNYKMVADFHFFYTSRQRGARFMNIKKIIAVYASGGVSDVNRITVILGWRSIIKRTLHTEIYYLYLIAKESLKVKLRKLIKA